MKLYGEKEFNIFKSWQRNEKKSMNIEKKRRKCMWKKDEKR